MARSTTLIAARSEIYDSDHVQPRVKPQRTRQCLAVLFKSPRVSLFSHAGPSTIKNPYERVLVFMFWPLFSLDSSTKGPFHSFLHINPSIYMYNYVSSPWFLSYKSCRPSFLTERSLYFFNHIFRIITLFLAFNIPK
jgi:hypothetical protein